MTETSSSKCPQCGAEIPADAPQGLCPKCLLKQASFPTETGHTTRHSRPAPPDRDELARAFPHLQILELIGQGGMGFVYKARQPKLDRVVALKILAQPLAEQTQFAERFTREGRTLAKLNHPNIVTIHDFGQAGPFFYLLMEYVDGVNLRQAMRAGAINSAQALAIVPRICEALQYAHNEGVLHRDIKPDNILLDTRGRVKIADFGIAKLMAEAVAENPLTGSGASLGTPHYMAPEQIEKPNAVDHRADIYSLGVVFYEMLTGELPLGRFAAPSEKSGNDPRLDEIVFQTLEKQPERRPQSADEVRTRVETISTTAAPATLPEPAIAFKMARCSITSPEFLATWIGRLVKYFGHGDLRLDAQNLTYAPKGNWTVIPLRAITQLTLGTSQIGLCRMKILAVAFTEKNEFRQIYLVPNRGAMRSVFDNNDLVEEWFSAVQFAIKSATGKLPPITREDLRPTSGVVPPKMGIPFVKGFAAFLLFFTICLLLLGAILNRRERSPSPKIAPNPIRVSLLTSPNTSSVLNVTAVYVTNRNGIVLRTKSDPAAGETFIPVIRYNNGPWSQSEATRSFLQWVTDKSGVRHEGMYQWRVPAGFDSEFDLAAAASRARARAEQAPIPLSSSDPVSIFEVTNRAGQVVSGGIRLVKSPVAKQTAFPVAKIRDFSATLEGATLRGYGRVETPPGYRLIARSSVGDEPTFAKTSGNQDTFQWDLWPTAPFSSRTTVTKADLLEVSFGEPFEITSFPNSKGEYFRAILELVPMSGVVPPAIAAKPVKSAPPPKKAESIELTLFSQDAMRGGLGPLQPRKLRMEALLDVNLDEMVYASLHSFSSEPIPIQWDQSDPQNMWTYSGPGETNRIATFDWTFPQNFGLQNEILPALFTYWGTAQLKTVRIERDRPTRLFTVTNALGHVVACDLEYKKYPAMVKDPKAGVLIASAYGYQKTDGVSMDMFLNFPTDAQIIPYAEAAGERVPASLTRRLDDVGNVTCEWRYPKGFLAPPVQPDPSRKPYDNKLTSVNTATNATFLDKFTQVVRASDARITAGKPVQVFSLTNSEGKVFSGFLELSRAKK